MAPSRSFPLRLPLTLLLLWWSPVVLVSGQVGVNSYTDYTCSPKADFSPDNQCTTINNGVCDNPNLGGEGGDACRNQDCIDCNYHCQAFNADCYGCLGAKGCYYCPGDATCQNYDRYTSTNKILSCNQASDFILGGSSGDLGVMCVPPDTAYTADPLDAANRWAYDMINVKPVWRSLGFTGRGVRIRINDDGVDAVGHPEFTNRFSEKDSCPIWAPLPPSTTNGADANTEDEDNSHGTAVAGIVVANADNDHCAAGIAFGATISSCNFFASPKVPFENLAYQLGSFDISQNSIGLPPCTVGSTAEDAVIDPTTTGSCPFAVPEGALENPCDPAVCDFSSSALSKECEDAITFHCKAYYRDDVEACLDYNDIILGGGKTVSCDYDALPQSARDALADGILNGRGGKGSVFVFASGNSFFEGDDLNMSGFTNSRYTITVGAVGKDGKHTDYSTPGAALMVTGPAGDYTDVAHLLTAGLGGTCADSGPGTSFSAPVVSGVIALMLEARPELTWRDVQGILASTSQRVDDSKDVSAVINSAGYWVSNWYGFGIVDAQKAVLASQTWELLAPEEQAIGASEEVNQPVPNDGTEFVSLLTIGSEYEGFVAESTVVLVNLQHYNRGDLKLTLVSPSGTESVLLAGRRPENTKLEGDERWKLMTVRNWGEDPTGEWQLKVQDVVTDDNNSDASTNEFRQWKLTVYGRTGSGNEGGPTETPISSPTVDPGAMTTGLPSASPTKLLAFDPTNQKTPNPSPAEDPTDAPMATSEPIAPTMDLTDAPIVTSEPMAPTMVPIMDPLPNPTSAPVIAPTAVPTPSPTQPPTDPPTKSPTLSPTKMPTSVPILRPTRIVPNPSPPSIIVPAPTSGLAPIPFTIPGVPPVPAPIRPVPPPFLNNIGNVQRPSSLVSPPTPAMSLSSTVGSPTLISASSRFSSFRTIRFDTDDTDNAVSFSLEEVDNLTLVLEGVTHVPESSWPSLEKILREHTTSVVASIFPAVHFQSAIEVVSVTPKEQEPDRRRKLRPALTPSVTVVYNEWTEFDRSPETEHLTASTLAALAFENSEYRSDFVDAIRANCSGDPNLQSLIGVSTVGLPATTSPSATLTELQPTRSPTKQQHTGSPISSTDLSDSWKGIFAYSGEVVKESGDEAEYGSKSNKSASDVSKIGMLCWIAVGIGIVAIALIFVLRRRRFVKR